MTVGAEEVVACWKTKSRMTCDRKTWSCAQLQNPQDGCRYVSRTRKECIQGARNVVVIIMHIEEIVLEGFKSYATRTVITGWDKDFNAITGLNGSGKSNILDAICFVLGIDNLRQVKIKMTKSYLSRLYCA